MKVFTGCSLSFPLWIFIQDYPTAGPCQSQCCPAVNRGVLTPHFLQWEDTVNVVDGLPDMGAYELGVDVEIGVRSGSPDIPGNGTQPNISAILMLLLE